MNGDFFFYLWIMQVLPTGIFDECTKMTSKIFKFDRFFWRTKKLFLVDSYAHRKKKKINFSPSQEPY